MKFINVNMNYFKQVLDIATQNYKNECKYTEEISGITEEDISKELEDIFQKENGLICIEDDKVIGYLIYKDKWEDDIIMNYSFPFYGYGAVGEDKIKIMSRLFEVLADKLCNNQEVHFQVKLYAHDTEIIKLFSFLQFGIQCEEGICNIDVDINDNNKIADIKELSKNEIMDSWTDIWNLLNALVNHLRKSPVFYPGDEFTEEVYKDYLLDENTRLFVSKKEDTLIGIITANKDGNSFINNNSNCYNVGDVYVIPEYRGKKVAQSMLKFLSNTLSNEGIKKLWVEHGTANPNARGFWNKYFKSYSYTMIRSIDKI